MPQLHRPVWVNTLKEWLNISPLCIPLYVYVIGAVYGLLCFCLVHMLDSEKTPAVNAPQPVYDHFCCCSSCKASCISPFFIKLPYYMPINQPPQRLVIYASDIRQLTGVSKSTSKRQLYALKEKLGRQTHQYVTIEEYCIDMGLNYEKTLQQLKLK